MNLLIGPRLPCVGLLEAGGQRGPCQIRRQYNDQDSFPWKGLQSCPGGWGREVEYDGHCTVTKAHGGTHWKLVPFEVS